MFAMPYRSTKLTNVNHYTNQQDFESCNKLIVLFHFLSIVHDVQSKVLSEIYRLSVKHKGRYIA